jgi:hypothetical protein
MVHLVEESSLEETPVLCAHTKKGGWWVVRGGAPCSGIFPEASIGVLLEGSDSPAAFCFALALAPGFLPRKYMCPIFGTVFFPKNLWPTFCDFLYKIIAKCWPGVFYWYFSPKMFFLAIFTEKIYVSNIPKMFFLAIFTEKIYVSDIVRDRIARQVRGKAEVKCACGGFADVVSRNWLVEVKQPHEWRHGVGQLLAYGADPQQARKRKRLHLLGSPPHQDVVQSVCSRYGIRLTVDAATPSARA